MSETASRPRSFAPPTFIVSGIVLALAAVGLRPAIAALIDYYSKEPIDLVRPLNEFDTSRLPSFRYLPERDDYEIAFADDDIGTDDWIAYVFNDRDRTAAGATADLMLLVTYYSDPRDSIPHTPEVCYRQAGAVVSRDRTVTIPTPGLGPEFPEVEMRLLDVDQNGRRLAVGYVICCNRRLFSGREGARWEIGRPGDKYTFFSKVEAVSFAPSDIPFEVAVERCKKLLTEALPVLLDDHYPDQATLSQRD